MFSATRWKVEGVEVGGEVEDLVDEWVVLGFVVVFLLVVWWVELVGAVDCLLVVRMLLCVVELLVTSACVDVAKSRLRSQQVWKSILMLREYSKTMQ